MNKKEKIICWLIVFRPILIVIGSILTFFIVNHIVIIKVWHINEVFELSYFVATLLHLLITMMIVLLCALVLALLAMIGIPIWAGFGLKKARMYLKTRYDETVISRKKQKDRF